MPTSVIFDPACARSDDDDDGDKTRRAFFSFTDEDRRGNNFEMSAIEFPSPIQSDEMQVQMRLQSTQV